MSADLAVVLITVLVFGGVSIAVFVVAQLAAVQFRVRRRVAAHAQDAEISSKYGFDALISAYFDEKRFGVQGSVRTELRRELVRAGFFRPNAINYYIFARLASVLVLTTIGYLLVDYFVGFREWYLKFSLVALIFFMAVRGPYSSLPRRRRKLLQRFRVDFPDMLDLVVVCVDAGLSIEAALDRIRGQISRQNYYLGSNLQIMGAEMR